MWRIRHGLPIRRIMVTRGMDLCSITHGFLSEKVHKSIPRVTIFLLIDTSWWMLCLPIHKTLTYATSQLIFNVRFSNVIYSVKCVKQTSTSKRFATRFSLEVCDAAVVDSPQLQCYLHIKGNT